MKWKKFSPDQFYEYYKYNGYIRLVAFAEFTADRRIILENISLVGVLENSKNFDKQELNQKILFGKYLAPTKPSLFVNIVPVWPHLINDCTIDEKGFSTGKKHSEFLLFWDAVASTTRNPIECAFGILEAKFCTFGEELSLNHEGNFSFVVFACILLHNMCIKDDCNQEYNIRDLVGNEAEVTVAKSAAKKQTDTFLHCVSDKKGSGYSANHFHNLICHLLLNFVAPSNFSITFWCLSSFLSINFCIGTLLPVFACLCVLVTLSSSVHILFADKIDGGSYRAFEFSSLCICS